MARPVDSKVSMTFASALQDTPMTAEELKQEQEALEAEEEEKAIVEQEAEDEELSEPLDQYTQEGLEHDLDRLNP